MQERSERSNLIRVTYFQATIGTYAAGNRPKIDHRRVGVHSPAQERPTKNRLRAI